MKQICIYKELYEGYNGYIHHIKTWQELVSNYQEVKKLYPQQKVLLILDDENQCDYTSMHATLSDELDFGELDGVENQRPLEIAHYQQQILKSENQAELSTIQAKMSMYNEEDFKAIAYIHNNPMSILDDGIDNMKMVRFKVADVASDSLKIAIQPNGYFRDDLNTFENYFIIKKLAEYGYEFIGLGASLLGFVKTDTFNDNNIVKIQNFLLSIYPSYVEQVHNELYEDIAITENNLFLELINNNNFLLLPYIEGLGDYFP